MTLWRLATNGLRFFWRSNLGVFLGAILATAILAGALAVGDSVRYSLRRIALSRLGEIQYSLYNPGRFFREQLATEARSDLKAPVVPIVLMRGAVSSGEGEARVGRVQVIGATDAFWQLGGAKPPVYTTTDGTEGIAVNDRMAHALDVKVGDDVLVRVDKPSLLSRDAPLSTIEDATVTLRLPVTAIVTEADYGRFSLEANQVPPHNAFLPIAVLQRAIGMEGRANTLLVAKTDAKPEDVTAAVWKNWKFADAGLELKEVKAQGVLELSTDRVFLDPPVGDAAKTATPDARGVLTYFVNELRVGNKATPYSTVAAMQGPLIPRDMRDDEALISSWFAEDVGAKVGDTVKLTYWLVGPMRRLELHSSEFKVRGILPLTGPANDPALMPNIPGLADKKDCRDWEPGVPIDLNKIRDKDQEYWTKYRGTPKAFITLKAGQRIWDNRFGNLTAVRYPSNGPETRAKIEMCIRQALNPASLGVFFQPIRDNALNASSGSTDFGQLFIGFSLFLIVAALLLTALLFGFNVEQRGEEVGTLLAIGLRPVQVRRLLLMEGGLLALIAAVVGVGVATLYTRAVIGGLSTIWSGAVANSSLIYHAEPATLAAGGLASFLIALFVIWLVARRQAQAPARQLLSPGSDSAIVPLLTTGKRAPGLITAVLCGLAAIGLAGKAATAEGTDAASFFFGAGALLLIAGIAVCRLLMARWERGTGASALTVPSLGVRNSVRRPGRSLGAIALFACGSFLVLAVGAGRHDPNDGARNRNSGTGGFALYGEASLPVYQNLNTNEGRETYALDPAEMQGVDIVAMRLREGDEANCLNLNRPQTPRLLGVDPNAFATRRAFTFQQTQATGGQNPWGVLDRAETDGAVPVIGDMSTVVWSLGKKLGDTLDYTDDRGNTHKLRIVGVLGNSALQGNSILQGALILSETNFVRLFPTQSGYQVFLVDAPATSAANVSKALTRGLEDVGLSVTPAPERLAAFNTVENTYLSIFAILGGLGLLLGSVGLGVIVLRNVWERRGELALLRAVGFRRDALHRLVFAEHAILLALGLAVGVVSALVAVLPALRSPGADVPWLSLFLTLLAVFVSGLVWTWVATTIALRSPLLAALRNE
jgi:ABC-type antimicrobial peptide transport system permease subunit